MALPTLIAQTQWATGFTVRPDEIQGNSIGYEWATMPGNKPQTNANTAFIWQTRQQAIPLGVDPEKHQPVGSNAEEGSDTFSGLTVTSESYLLAYAVGSAVASICATVFVPEIGGGDPLPAGPSVSVGTPGSTSLSFLYTMPDGTRPQTDGDWAGLWEGQSEAALYLMAPTWKIQIKSDQPSNNASFTGIAIKRNTVYTVGYFKGGWDPAKPKQSTLACSTTFHT